MFKHFLYGLITLLSTKKQYLENKGEIKSCFCVRKKKQFKRCFFLAKIG